jgi:hypothetical protein
MCSRNGLTVHQYDDLPIRLAILCTMVGDYNTCSTRSHGLPQTRKPLTANSWPSVHLWHSTQQDLNDVFKNRRSRSETDVLFGPWSTCPAGESQSRALLAMKRFVGWAYTGSILPKRGHWARGSTCNSQGSGAALTLTAPERTMPWLQAKARNDDAAPDVRMRRFSSGMGSVSRLGSAPAGGERARPFVARRRSLPVGGAWPACLSPRDLPDTMYHVHTTSSPGPPPARQVRCHSQC